MVIALDKILITKNSILTDNSNEVRKNSVFIAIEGTKFDGHQYVAEALKNGASVVVINHNHEQEVKQLTDNYIAVTDTRDALAYLASKKYTLPKKIVAVTGTDGKTSTAFFYKEILSSLNKKAAAVGTMGVLSNTQKEYFDQFKILTTPGTLQLYQILSELKNAGIENISLEASSHGIIQKRLDFIPLQAAAFTSFGRDHLDYHKDLDDYLNAKLRLFNTLLPKHGVAIFNNDMDIADKVKTACGPRDILTYGYKGQFLKIDNISYNNTKMSANFIINNQTFQIRCNLFGDFQIYNLACAITLLHATGYSYKETIEVIPTLNSVPGRMQRVENFNIFIDYAHTPDSLLKALSTLKHGTKKDKKLIVVFGCGGDRDKGKRSLMGKVAAQHANIAIITDDNPRTEDPSQIRNEIHKHCKNGINIDGRENAIKYAIKQMNDGDTLLIAGKGHETYQILADKTIDFSDYEVAQSYASKYLV